jgi:predicted metal-dependent enzyme (double-stranded beta helix superfamily)
MRDKMDAFPVMEDAMCDTGYSVKRLVEDMKELREGGADDAAMAEAVPDLAKRLVLMKHNWLRPYMCEPNTSEPNSAGVFALHEEADHSLAVFVVTWLPGDETPPHDHGTWAVIAGLDGWETNHRWKRIDDGLVPGYADVRRDCSERIDAGTIVSLPPETIHSVHNDSGGKSVTLHIYGVHVDHTDRHKFDPIRHAIAPYRLGATSNSVTSR